MKFPKCLLAFLLLILIVEECCALGKTNNNNGNSNQKSRGCSLWPWRKKTQTPGSKPTPDPKQCTDQQGAKTKPAAALKTQPVKHKPSAATKPHPPAKTPSKVASPSRPVSPPKKPALQRTGSGSWRQEENDNDFKRKLNQHNIRFENMRVNGGQATGRIDVKNLAFQKTVKVRYSLDNWKTWQDVLATHDVTSADRSTDFFNVHFKLDPKKAVPGTKLQFAAVYIVSGKQYWDNNENRNYDITLN